MDERYLDHPGEQTVHLFLMMYFYPIFHQYQEISDKKQQIAGIDMKLCVNNHWFTVDEKTQLTRLNQKITQYTTQALELLSKTRNGKFRLGWIFNTQTDYYLFTYITECSTEIKKELSIDKIHKIRAILISKKQIEQMLLDNGITLKNLKFFAYQIMFYNYYDRIKNGNTYIDFKEITDKIWICHTSPDKLYETPVNCVIKWSLYEQYAWHVYDITVNNVIKIK